MKRLLLLIPLILCLSLGALAQGPTPADVKKTTDVLEKMRQIDLLNQMLPLLLQKDQMKKLLDVIDKARRDVRTQEAEEAKLIAGYADRVNQAVTNGIEKGDVPDKALLKELNALIQLMTMKRRAIADDNTDMVLAVVKTTLNAGQIKAAANSLSTAYTNPGVKPEEVKEEDKLRFFVRDILLDPLAYDILDRMYRSKIG